MNYKYSSSFNNFKTTVNQVLSLVKNNLYEEKTKSNTV